MNEKAFLVVFIGTNYSRYQFNLVFIVFLSFYATLNVDSSADLFHISLFGGLFRNEKERGFFSLINFIKRELK